jgi:hypothetical protein
MSTRRRRPITPKPEAPVETTHEEMLEVASEREEVAEFLDVMAEEAFADLGEQDFFQPEPTPTFVAIPPAPTIEQPIIRTTESMPLLSIKQPRYLLRQHRTRDSRRG